MAAQAYTSLRYAVTLALHERGTALLDDSKAFLGYMLDNLDPNSIQAKILARNCDEELLGIFAKAASLRDTSAIEEAAIKAAYLLEHECMIEHDGAEWVACEIAFALANYLSLECPERIRLVAVQGVQKQQSSTEETDTVDQKGTTEAPAQEKAPPPETPASNAWYEAQKARQAKGAKSQAVGTKGSGANSSAGPRVSGDVDTDAQSQGIDFSSFSTDCVERQRQAEAAGMGMRWFEWLRCICWIAAGAAFVNAGIAVAILAYASSGKGLLMYDGLYVLYVIMAAVYVLLCGWYLESRRRLTGFRTSGPKTYLCTSGVDCLFYWLTRMSAYVLLGERGLYGSSTPLVVTAVTVFNAFLWFATYKYLKNREELFTL